MLTSAVSCCRSTVEPRKRRQVSKLYIYTCLCVLHGLYVTIGNIHVHVNRLYENISSMLVMYNALHLQYIFSASCVC